MFDRDTNLIWEAYKNKLNEALRFPRHESATKDIRKDVIQQAKSKGYNIEAFHGSKEKKLTEISKTRTAFGYFFAPDRYTADFYTTEGKGKTYHVLLKANQILDLTDDSERYNFFKEYMVSGEETYMKYNEDDGTYSDIDNDDYIQLAINLYKANEQFKNYINSIASKDPNFDYDLANISDDEIGYMIEDYIGDTDALLEIPAFKAEMDKHFKLINPEFNEIEQSYNNGGPNDFYMNYQNEVMRTASRNSYDMVIFQDYSFTGEGLSYVVFESNKIKLADDETFDDDGNVIPLSERFDETTDDFRY
jgi:hypothetical protein